MCIHSKRAESLINRPLHSNYILAILRSNITFIRYQYISGSAGALFNESTLEEVEFMHKHFPRICSYYGITIRIETRGTNLPYFRFI